MSTPTTNTDTEPTSDRAVWSRRPVLKALALGAGLSLGGGVVAAQDGTPTDELDSYYGVATPDASEVPDGVDPDHEVELHVDLPEDLENPSRPPLFHYEPTGLQVAEGDVVQFTAVTPDHTVTAYHPGLGFQQRVPDGVPPFSSPVLSAGAAWFYAFDEPGVYDVYCGPHHILGMVMRLVVGEVEELPEYVGTFEGRPPSEDQPPLFAPFSRAFLEHELNALSDANEDCEWPWLTPAEVLGAPALDPENIVTEGSVSFDSVLADIERFAAVESHGVEE